MRTAILLALAPLAMAFAPTLAPGECLTRQRHAAALYACASLQIRALCFPQNRNEIRPGPGTVLAGGLELCESDEMC